MNKERTCWTWAAALGVLCLAIAATAAEFSPALEAELAAKSGDEFVSAIVFLESPLDIRALDAKLHEERADRATRYRTVIEALHYNAEQTQPAFRAEFDRAISEGRMTGYTAHWIDNLFVIHAQKSVIESFRARGDVKYMTENFKAELIEPILSEETQDSRNARQTLDNLTIPPGIVAVGAQRVNEELGITGQGVLVGNCDTGVDGSHPALASRWRGNFAPWQECWRDALGTGTTFPEDNNNHGTHVMGTITGRAISGSDTIWIGCAPNARWIADNAINQGVGGDFDNDIIDAFQWFANPDGNIATMDDVPDVVQNSWGVFTGLGYIQCFDYWNSVILNCEAAGVVVTWSAGNEASSGLRSPAIYSLNETQIFSVGAVDATNYSAPYPIAYFSSLGPTPCAPANPNNIKPEISAPGVDVYSSIPGGGYDGTYSGTSMAGPHVAGVVALMREACPDCDPQTIKEAIIATAIRDGYVTPPATENNTFGNGFIDAYAAVVAVSNLGRVAGVVTDASANPLAGAKVANPSGSQFVFTDASGQYYLPLPGGEYTIEFSKFGYITQTQAGVNVTEGDTTYVNKTLPTAPQGTVSGIVTSCFGGPMAGATVEVLNTPLTPATTNGAGYYEITLPQGTYDMRASGAGCGPQTVNGVVVGTSATQNFTLPTDPIYDCSAPDGGGYIACEDGDLSGPTYTWVEISPNAGGPGALTGITGDDSYGSFPLPFGFVLYGVSYNTVYVSSNGYLSFGSGSSTYTNTTLPSSSIGPALFPFWDDLYPGAGGDISYYYYAAENAYIVEWRQIQHYPSGSPETFQVWLINDLGPNGSSRIRFQYQALSNGSSCTIGVQNGSVANQYVYNGTLDANAQGLTNSRVITYGGSGCEGTVDISVSPISISGQAPLGGGDSEILQICNAGACPLSWSISFDQTTPALAARSARPGAVVEVSKSDAALLEHVLRGDKGVEDPRRGTNQLDASGGPDTFGYTWKDSNEPDGPVFNWMEISTIGTNLGITFDDQTVSVTLPWTFRFYGADYAQVNVSSNGNLHFGTASTAYSNVTIPTSSTPNAMIAPFWDDLYPPTAGTVYSYHDAANNRFIVQFHQMAHISESTARLTFQAILYQSGRIVFQYLTLNGSVTSCTVGIEDAAGAVGLPVVYNAAYLTNNLAIEFGTTPQWLTFGSPTSGVLETGQCTDVTLLFDAGDLAAGTYDGELSVISNDPDENPVTVPVEFHVGQLGTPTGLTIFYDPDAGNLIFRWQAVAGAVSYRVYSSPSPDGPFETPVGTSATTSLSAPAPASSPFFYVVAASDEALTVSQPSSPEEAKATK